MGEHLSGVASLRLMPATTEHLADLTVADLVRRTTSGEVSALAVTEACLERIAERDPHLNAFSVVFAEEAPWATLDHSVSFVPMRKEVEGFVQSPLGDFSFEGVDLAE